MSFPNTRLRRLRYNSLLRELVSETQLSVNDLIYPLFVCEGEKIKNEIPSMPGQFQFSIDNLIMKCKQVQEKGIKAILIFGVSKNKDKTGDIACSENSIVQRAIKAIKEENINLLLIADVCNCEYTSHGHCGTIVDGDVENDLTLSTLAKQSLSLVRAGADIIAPSDMMDGRVQAIRKVLDSSGFYKVPILSYSAKYASSFYSPFRDAADSSPKGFDRKTYQMNYSNSDEAIREVEQDVLEGADMIMIKPGMPYLDVCRRAKDTFGAPTYAYQVSGEYSMLQAAMKNGWLDPNKVIMESLLCFKRAGCDGILTYFAPTVAKELNN